MMNPTPNPKAINVFLTPPRNQHGMATANTIITPNPNQLATGPSTATNNTATAPVPPPNIAQAPASTKGTPAAANVIQNIQANQTVLSLPPLAPYLGPFAATC